MAKRAFIIAGTHSGAGKTTIALGFMAALKKRGLTVQPFKTGPDYIDPGHHSSLCKRPSYNLDTWMMGTEGVKKTFAMTMAEADAGIIEGVMGLFDGKDGKKEEGSTAHLAKTLGLPVLLVVDARSMGRSAGALVYGFEGFDRKVNIAGVVLNRVGSLRHFKMLKDAIEQRCRSKVLGYIPRDMGLVIPERHLGLITGSELKAQASKFRVFTERLVDLVEENIDLDILLSLSYKTRRSLPPHRHRPHNPKPRARIAVALDDAFSFYYQENLDILKGLGAELIFFSPLKCSRLPDTIDGLYIGGGYPELHASELASNTTLKKEIKALAQKGMPIYAECGGMMYLGRVLKDLKGRRYRMVGIFPWTSSMLGRRRSLGYREIVAMDGCPFLKEGETIRGHEFHYSEIDEPPDLIKNVYLIDSNGEETYPEGYLY
ncbi:MAG: cobyrinate a,c-diamide synthase, partial [Thermodesulfobacteriota bacterium]